jgi:hypothetical protein
MILSSTIEQDSLCMPLIAQFIMSCRALKCVTNLVEAAIIFTSMTKPSEEGGIWEWRAFGRISDALAPKVRAYPVRFGLIDIDGEDIYLVSRHNDQNVKFRNYPGGWVLKFKLLVETKPGPFELYNERPEFTFQLPVSLARLTEAAGLLGVKLPEAGLSVESFSKEDFVKALAEATPPVAEIRVAKRRSQFQFENGWLELAEVKFQASTVQSISVHSRELEVVKKMRESLQPGNELEAMNYIEACRRWG